MSKVKEEMLLRYPIGTRVRLIHIDDIGDLMVSWDDGSSLKLIVGIDAFEVVSS